MAESLNKPSNIVDTSLGQGEFKGDKATCVFERTASSDTQELWLIKDKDYIPGNYGNLTAEDVSRVVGSLMEKDRVQQILNFSGHDGGVGGVLVLTERPQIAK